MKCKKCGADIPSGYVYCKVCGNEVQLVSEYSDFEEDLLSEIVKEEAGEALHKKAGKSSPLSHTDFLRKKKEEQKNAYLWKQISMVVVIAVVVLILVWTDIHYKNKNSYSYQYKMAEKSLNKEDYEKAVSYFERAWKLKPTDKEAPHHIADIYIELGQQEKAEDLLLDMIEENSSDKETYKKLIALYDKEKRYEEIRTLCDGVKSSEILELFSDYLVDQPRFSRISGRYTGNMSVSISSYKGYDIYYTTDGTNPVTNGKRYSSAIALRKGTTVLQAVTKNEKGIYSEIVKVTYTLE